MENRYTTLDRLLLLDSGEYLGCWYRIISYGRFPGVYIAPNVHSSYYCNIKQAAELFKDDIVKGRFVDAGETPNPSSPLNPQYTPDGNLAWWFGWAYNGKGDHQAGLIVGREWSTAEMVEAAKRYIDTIVGNEQQRQLDEGTHVLSPVGEREATVETEKVVKSPPDKGKTKNKGGRPRGTGKKRGNKPA